MNENEICNILEDIAHIADHQIPYYAYGDNEAACEMSSRLKEIYDKAMQNPKLIIKE